MQLSYQLPHLVFNSCSICSWWWFVWSVKLKTWNCKYASVFFCNSTLLVCSTCWWYTVTRMIQMILKYRYFIVATSFCFFKWLYMDRSLTLVSLSLEFTSPRGWMEVFGSAPTPSSPSKGRDTKCTTSMLETLQMRSHSGTIEHFNLFSFWSTCSALELHFRDNLIAVKLLHGRSYWVFHLCLFILQGPSEAGDEEHNVRDRRNVSRGFHWCTG